MRYLLIFCFMLLAELSFGQDNYFYLNWDINMPLSNTSWIGNTSARGARAGYRAFIIPRLSAGVDVGWSTFDQYHPTITMENPTGAVTTDYFKYVYSYSLAASAQYYFPVGEARLVFPYAGLGLGANNNNYVVYYNIYRDNSKSWGFLARPEAGVLVKFGRWRSMGVMAAVHYDYSTNKSEKFDYNNFSSLGFQVGFFFQN